MPVVINGSTGISGTDGSAGTPAIQGTDSNTGMFFPAADQIAFAEGGVEAMRLDANGNVGIGTTTPGVKLDVAGYTRLGNYGGAFQGLTLQNNNNSASAETFSFVDTQNNLGTTDTNIIFAHQTDGGSFIALATTPPGSRSSDRRQERVRITSNGLFCAGRTTSLNGHVLAGVDGASTYRETSSSGFGVHHFYSNVGGTQTLKSFVQSDGQYINVSDANYKTDISPARGYLNDLLSIQVVNYRWKGDEQGGKRVGVIAQQVEEIFPSLVKEVVGNPDTGKTQKMIPLEAFIPMLITAVQELKAENEALKARVAALEIPA